MRSLYWIPIIAVLVLTGCSGKNNPTAPPSPVPTNTDTPGSTGTPTATTSPTQTPAGTATHNATASPSGTPTLAFTMTASGTPTGTATNALSPTGTSTPTSSPTSTNSEPPSPTVTWTPTITSTVSFTPTPTATDSPTSTVTPTDTDTPTVTTTLTPTPTGTSTSSEPPSLTVTSTPTATPTSTLADTSTVTPTGTDTPTVTASSTPTSSATVTPTSTSTQTGTNTPTSTPVLFAANINLSIPEDSSVTISFASFVTDPAGTNHLEISLVSYPAHGSLEMIDTTHVVFTSINVGFTGVDTFTYMAIDTATGYTSNIATGTIQQNPVPPVAKNGAVTVLEDNGGVISLPSFVTDPQNLNGSDNLLYISPPGGNHGALTISDTTGQGAYTPVQGFFGTDSFTYYVQDTLTNLFSNTATITIQVTGYPPYADDGLINSPENGSGSAPLSLLVNDPAGPDPLAFSLVSNPSSGMAVINASTGFATYTPNPGFYGTDSFTYEATDTLSGVSSDIATIIVHVIAFTSTNTATLTATPSPTDTPTRTATNSPTATPTNSPMATATNSPTGTSTSIPLVTPTVTPSCATLTNYGKTNQGATPDNIAGNAVFDVVSLSSPTTLYSFSAYTTGTGHISMAVYTSNGACGGGPETLLAQTGASACVNGGWSTLFVQPTTLGAGKYWIGIQTENTVGLFEDSIGGVSNEGAYPLAFGAFPSSYPSCFPGYDTNQQSMYFSTCP